MALCSNNGSLPVKQSIFKDTEMQEPVYDAGNRLNIKNR